MTTLPSILATLRACRTAGEVATLLANRGVVGTDRYDDCPIGRLLRTADGVDSALVRADGRAVVHPGWVTVELPPAARAFLRAWDRGGFRELRAGRGSEGGRTER